MMGHKGPTLDWDHKDDGYGNPSDGTTPRCSPTPRAVQHERSKQAFQRRLKPRGTFINTGETMRARACHRRRMDTAMGADEDRLPDAT
jgi:hypothetical protein